MPIKLLDAQLVERKHLHTLPLSALSDTRLGIDASHYLSQLLEKQAREPLLAATGGLPLALTTRIESDLRALEKYRVKPVFVFPGLQPNKRFNKAAAFGNGVEQACKDRRDAWDHYERGRTDAATRLFDGKSTIVQWDLWRSILRIFRHRNVEFLIAPYVAWAQLIYLQRHPKAYIHSMFASTDALLYPGVDKLVTALDLASPQPTFTWVSKRALFADFGISEDLFLDVCILAGFEHSPTFPAQGPESQFKSFVDMVKYYKSGFACVSAFADHPMVKATQYAEHFARTRSMIKYSLILSSDGSVVPLPLALPNQAPGSHQHVTAADIPQDLHDIFTNRLPDEIYFYLSRGLLGPQALVWLTSGIVIESPPLDNGDTNEYRRFVKEVITEGGTGPRATALALISGVCNQWWASKRVVGQFWFDHQPNQKYVQHGSPGTTQLVDRVSGWTVSYGIVEEELRRQNSSTIDFSLCLGATSNEKFAARTRAKNNPTSAAHPLDKKDEVVANVIWRFLELRGFLLSSHIHSALARAMHIALKGTRVNDKFQDSLYLFLELVRAGVLHGNLWSGRAYSGGPSFGQEDEKRSMLLVMRVLSIVPLSFKPQPWAGPLSRELLVFNSFLRSLSRALRTLIEVAALNMLLRADARRGRDDLLDIALSLPFQTDVNTGFGILAKVYLDALSALNGGNRVTDREAEGVSEAKEGAIEIVEETFPGIKGPASEVERGFRFWDVALTAIRSLHAENGVVPELAEQFEAAEAWLAPMRP